MPPKELPMGHLNRTVSPSVANHVLAITKKNNKENLFNLHGKIKQDKKVSCAHHLGYHDKGQGHNQRSKVFPLQIVCQP